MDTLKSGCPTENELAEYQAHPSGHPAIARHVHRCAECLRVVDRLAELEGGTLASGANGEVEEGRRVRARTVDRKYELLGLLGQGGGGAVFEARYTRTGGIVAVKLIHPRQLVESKLAVLRFVQEVKAPGRIDSPHVVAVLDAGEDEATGELYLVTERLHGEDLHSLVKRVGALPPDVALRIVAQALEGLAKVHEAGIVHRDVKPENIFLARRGDGEVTVKLLDFGIAKLMAGPLHLTGTAAFVGSPLYMSPEQLKSSKDVDRRTDLWSLGSVLYYALAGRAPFAHEETLVPLIVAICSAAPPSMRTYAPSVPLPLTEVVHRALARDRDQRYPSAEAMLEALRRLLPEGDALREEMVPGGLRDAVVAPRPGTPLRRRAIVTLPVLLLGAVLTARLVRARRPGPKLPSPPPPGPTVLRVEPAPWRTSEPRQFTAAGSTNELPPGTYTMTYEGGAMSHAGNRSYEVTSHYFTNEGVECGHHLFTGPSLSSSTWRHWVEADDLAGGLPSVADVERANAGHRWRPFWFPGGPLYIAYIDDYYGDNLGPGSIFCVSPYDPP